MIAFDTLDAAWRDERARRLAKFHRLPALAERGLELGAMTVLAKRTRDRWGAADLAVDGSAARILALLAVAYWRPVSPSVIGTLRRATKAFARGDRALAAIHIAQTGLQKIDQDERTAFRLFAAERLLDSGVSPRELMAGLGLDPWPLDHFKYDPAEPRDEQGRWTDGDASMTPPDDTDANDDSSSPQPILVGNGSAANGTANASDGGHRVVVDHPDGTEEIRSGGTLAWRNNNPGNIDAGAWADRHGAIGRNGVQAIFPDEATGEAALDAELKGSVYAPLTLDAAIEKRTPPVAGNDTERTKYLVRLFSGLPGDAIVGDLDDDQSARLRAAIRRSEGWQVGTVTRSTKV